MNTEVLRVFRVPATALCPVWPFGGSRNPAGSWFTLSGAPETLPVVRFALSGVPETFPGTWFTLSLASETFP